MSDLEQLLDQAEQHPLAEDVEWLLVTNPGLLDYLHAAWVDYRARGFYPNMRLLLETARCDPRMKINTASGTKLKNAVAPVLARLLMVAYRDMRDAFQTAKTETEIE